MKSGAENRKKTIMAGALGGGALLAVIYIYTQLFGGNAPAPSVAPVITSHPAGNSMSRSSGSSYGATATGSGQSYGGANVNGPNSGGLGVAPGVAAAQLASTSAGLDPTLHEAAMLRTESLVYSGSGRNIFSATYTPPPAALAIPKNMPSARPEMTHVAAAPTGPPPPPPIELKFFGTEQRQNGPLQAFFLSGENVYLASQGDIVARKYKVLSITTSGAQIEDLVNNNTQTIPLQK